MAAGPKLGMVKPPSAEPRREALSFLSRAPAKRQSGWFEVGLIRERYLKSAIAAQGPHIQRDEQGLLDPPYLGTDEGLAEACARSVDQPADACLAGLQGLADGTDFVQQFGHGLASRGRCWNPL